MFDDLMCMCTFHMNITAALTTQKGKGLLKNCLYSALLLKYSVYSHEFEIII